MPESIRSASGAALRFLIGVFAFAVSAGWSIAEWLGPRVVALCVALRGWIERLPERIVAWRVDSAVLLRRLADALEPAAPGTEGAADGSDSEFADLLADLGAQAPAGEEAADAGLKDATIAALRGELHNLRDLGDRLARTEQERLALAARVAELEAGAAAVGPSDETGVARLERRLEQREGVLERAREQLAQQRARTEEWKRKAAERWHEITALRGRVKELERGPADTGVADVPAALPQARESRAGTKSGAGRWNPRAS